MDRKKKIELLSAIANGTASVYDLQPYVFILQKEGKNFISDGKTIGKEITDSELEIIKTQKIFIDEDDLKM